jgi:hypothetical protein
MPVAAILSITAEGIGYQWYSDQGAQRHAGVVRWSRVKPVTAFKRDLLVYDLICLQLESEEGEHLELDEEDPSWQDLVAALPKHLPGCRAWGDWFGEVAFPAFETKLQSIFERE